MNKQPCQLENLLMSSTCDVQFCADCGLFHVSMGPITLRLTEVHFKDFAKDLNTVMLQLQKKRLSENEVNTSNIRRLHS